MKVKIIGTRSREAYTALKRNKEQAGRTEMTELRPESE